MSSKASGTSTVWCVWTEWGEYEQWSRHQEGIFATKALAEAHADQLRAKRHKEDGSPCWDVVEVIEDEVLIELPPPLTDEDKRYGTWIAG